LGASQANSFGQEGRGGEAELVGHSLVQEEARNDGGAVLSAGVSASCARERKRRRERKWRC
jgi:hypothetical protein